MKHPEPNGLRLPRKRRRRTTQKCEYAKPTIENRNAAAVASSDLLCVRALVDALVTADSQLRIARHEEDATTDPQREAATFVKLNEKRIGRDLELYTFMAKMEGEQSTLARLLEELVLPLKQCSPKAFVDGIAQLRAFDVFGDRQTEWATLLDDLAA